MNAIAISDKVESESNAESVITTFQYLQINNNKAVKSGKLSKASVLLDTGSIYSVLSCKKMIVNIQKSDKTLRAFTNVRHQDSNIEGELP